MSLTFSPNLRCYLQFPALPLISLYIFPSKRNTSKVYCELIIWTLPSAPTSCWMLFTVSQSYHNSRCLKKVLPHTTHLSLSTPSTTILPGGSRNCSLNLLSGLTKSYSFAKCLLPFHSSPAHCNHLDPGPSFPLCIPDASWNLASPRPDGVCRNH